MTFRAPITREQHEIQSQEIYANDGLHYSIGGGGSLSPSSSGEDEDVEEERHVACVGPEAGDADNQFSKDPAATCTVRGRDLCVKSLSVGGFWRERERGGGMGRGREGKGEGGKEEGEGGKEEGKRREREGKEEGGKEEGGKEEGEEGKEVGGGSRWKRVDIILSVDILVLGMCAYTSAK